MDRPPATPPTNPPPHPEAPPDEDYVLRAQIATTEFLLRYGKYAGYVVALVLLVAFGYSSFTSWRHKAAQEQFGKIAALDYKMPQQRQFDLGDGSPPLVFPDDTKDEALMADLAEGARRYEAIAAEASGSARTVAWLRAVDAWQRAGKQEEAMAAAAHATESGGTSVASYAADAQKFATLADAAKNDEAEAQLRDMAGRYEGFFGEAALVRLANFQLDLGKTPEAQATFTEITTRFPSTNDSEALAVLGMRLGKAAPEPPKPEGDAAAPAPTP